MRVAAIQRLRHRVPVDVVVTLFRGRRAILVRLR